MQDFWWRFGVDGVVQPAGVLILGWAFMIVAYYGATRGVTPAIVVRTINVSHDGAWGKPRRNTPNPMGRRYVRYAEYRAVCDATSLTAYLRK